MARFTRPWLAFLSLVGMAGFMFGMLDVEAGPTGAAPRGHRTGADTAVNLASATGTLALGNGGTGATTAAAARTALAVAPVASTYIVQTADGELSGEQSLAALSTGIVKVTTGTGVLSTAVSNTDYAAAAHAARHISAGADAFGTTDLLEAVVKRLRETGGATLLVGAVGDGQYLQRSGTGLIGATISASDRGDTMDKYIRRALSKSTIASGDLSYLWEDFCIDEIDSSTPSSNGGGWYVANFGAGSTHTTLADTRGCAHRLGSSATASRSRMHSRTNSGDFAGGAAKYYIGARVRISTAIDAQASSVVAFATNAGPPACGDQHAVAVGARGAQSTTAFVGFIENGGTDVTLTSTVALDTVTWRTVELWGSGTQSCLSVDDETAVCSGTAVTIAAADPVPMHCAGNGTTAANRQLDIAWGLWAVAGP